LLADTCRHGHIQSPIPHITGKAEDIDPADFLNDLVHGAAPIQKAQEFVRISYLGILLAIGLQHAHAIGNKDILPVGIIKLDHLDLYFSHRKTYFLYLSNQLQILAMEMSISPGVKVQTAGRVESTIRATGIWHFLKGGMKKCANARQAIRGKKEIVCSVLSSEDVAWLSATRECVMQDAARSECGVGVIVPARSRSGFEQHFRPGCPKQPMGNDPGPQAAARSLQQPMGRPLAIPAL
jgi:hypothetical protein